MAWNILPLGGVEGYLEGRVERVVEGLTECEVEGDALYGKVHVEDGLEGDVEGDK